MAKGGGGRTDGRMNGRTDGHLEIPPCVLQDIGPLGPLPKKGKKKERLKKRKEKMKGRTRVEGEGEAWKLVVAVD